MPNQRTTNQLVLFSQCKNCGKHYELIPQFFDFPEDDELCIYCAQGERLPELIERLDFVVEEDLIPVFPKSFEGCFANIDKIIEQQIVKETTEFVNLPKKKPKRRYAKPKKV